MTRRAKDNESAGKPTKILERIRLLESKIGTLKDEVEKNKLLDAENNKAKLGEEDGKSHGTSHGSSMTSSEGDFRLSSDRFDDDGHDSLNSLSPIPPSSSPTQGRTNSDNSILTRRINADDDYKALSEDTFTMMIMSKPGSKQWWYALIIFSVQIILLLMILQDQFYYDYGTTPFDVPYRNTRVVHLGQVLAILLSLATQTDLVIAITTFIMLWTRQTASWTAVASVAEDSGTFIWIVRIALPLTFKFIEGVLVLLTTFVIVIQSDSMIELFKDFAAMQLISELDNMMFWIALHGYAGIELMQGARKAQKVRIKDDVVTNFCCIPLRTMVLVGLFFMMFSGWVYIANGQANGSFFYLKFPHCDIIEARIPSVGDGMCDGGAQNTIACNFDDGDCLAFNIAYPGCRVVETFMIGDGECNTEFNSIECGFDGGDCCPVGEDDRYGDGVCDGFIFNTEICNWDDGDCVDFNNRYPNCDTLVNSTLEELYHDYVRMADSWFGLDDGICHGFKDYAVEECGWEGGDCTECYQLVGATPRDDPDLFASFGDYMCDGGSLLNNALCSYDGGDCETCMEEFGNEPLFDATLLGDGKCDGGMYMSEECNFDESDCYDFIDSYPDCDAEHPWKVGDGNCDSEYDNPECLHDGGDCDDKREQFDLENCEASEINRIHNGVCDGGLYIREECAFDGGDCDDCTGNLQYIGDGICDGVAYMNEACGFDGGDCDQCDTQDISIVGDGICNEETNTPECYYDGGDCTNNKGIETFNKSTPLFDHSN